MLFLAVVSLVVVSRRWGSAAYSRWNLVAVSLLLASSAGVVLWRIDLSLTLRASLAALVSLLLVAAVRDTEGRMQARMILGRLRKASFPALSTANKAKRS